MPGIQRILVVGAVGQIGSELTLALRDKYGADNVVAAGRKTKPSPALRDSGPFTWCDVVDRARLDETIKEFKIDTIVNMAAILSATGEKNPQACWEVNVTGLINTLEAALEHKLVQVLCPSSIASCCATTMCAGSAWTRVVCATRASYQRRLLRVAERRTTQCGFTTRLLRRASTSVSCARIRGCP